MLYNIIVYIILFILYKLNCNIFTAKTESMCYENAFVLLLNGCLVQISVYTFISLINGETCVYALSITVLLSLLISSMTRHVVKLLYNVSILCGGVALYSVSILWNNSFFVMD